ncbi:hypothetical protein EB75_15825 [Mycobacterium sp. ST-F2]|uniref:hypothetical protein n=1 Tax=Mycobacterium sp. ST-F2 TaxID=1490484 RepID=UPI00093F982B|nr:hypothetical protein [Mycobacterium sp. ST-F2]OKH85760.1 hypothetical protein EB75_15825 [Mycobacterium sp. ST-F2]
MGSDPGLDPAAIERVAVRFSAPVRPDEVPGTVQVEVDGLGQVLPQQFDVIPIGRRLPTGNVGAAPEDSALAGVGCALLRPVDQVVRRVDGDAHAVVACVLCIGARHHQRLQLGTVQPAAQYLHALAVAPVEQASAEISGQLFARGERTPRHDGPPVRTVQVHPLERTVTAEERREGTAPGAGVGRTHVGPVDVTPGLVDDDSVGRLIDIGNQRPHPGTVERHRLDLSLGDVQHQ